MLNLFVQSAPLLAEFNWHAVNSQREVTTMWWKTQPWKCVSRKAPHQPEKITFNYLCISIWKTSWERCTTVKAFLYLQKASSLTQLIMWQVITMAVLSCHVINAEGLTCVINLWKDLILQACPWGLKNCSYWRLHIKHHAFFRQWCSENNFYSNSSKHFVRLVLFWWVAANSGNVADITFQILDNKTIL